MVPSGGTVQGHAAYQTTGRPAPPLDERDGLPDRGAGDAISDPDRELAARARRGDREALLALYERHRARLFGWLVRTTGNRQRAEDAFQETWMKAAHAITSYDPELGSFRGWLFRIANNAAIDRQRREARHEVDELDAPLGLSGETALDTLADASPAPDREAAGREFSEALVRALEALNPRQRAAVLMRHQQGLSYPEIALALNVAEGTAKTLVHRGVQILRRRLRRWADA